MRQSDHGISIIQSDGGKRPILGFFSTQLLEICFKRLNDLSRRGILFHSKRQQVRRQVISSWQLPSHPRLHMHIIGLWLQGYFMDNFPFVIDLNDARLLT